MIYLFYGDDTEKKISVYEKFIKALPQDTETFFISRNNFNPMQIESLYSGSSLFSNKSSVIFSGVLENEETRNFLLDKLQLIGDSSNSFIFLECKLNKPIVDAFKKVRAELNYFELPKEKKEKFDNFLIANAFANKDKLNTWVYFRQAMDLGASLEEINGIIFWKIKDMLLKKNFSKFKEEQLKTFVSKLSYLLPEARSAGIDAEAAFERFLLEAF
jgi:isopropylmalate/homocitrate/citramalate synthase